MTEINVLMSPPVVATSEIEASPVNPTAEPSIEVVTEAGGTPPAGLTAPGGTTGQVWTKASNDDYDSSWQDPTGIGGGIADAPNDGNYYVRHGLAWVIGATVIHTGAYSDLSGLPTLGTAAARADTFFAAAVHTHAATDIVSGVLADGRIQASNVTQHQASIAIAATQVTSGVLADGRVQASNVTQHQASIAIAATQVTSGSLADARVQQSNVTQHQAALSINYSQLTGTAPPLLVTKVYTVSSQVAQLALTAEEGDLAIRTDLNKTYARNTGSAGTMADWSEMLAPTAAVSSVFGRTGAVVATSGDYTFAQIGSTPTTAAGYGIPAATASVDGYATATQITKLNGIATAATANSADATLLARANHTGTQTADTITDGTTNKAYSATEKTKLAGIASGATANSSDATLEARANHTGTQSADTIVDGTTNKAYTATEKTKLAGVASGATANAADATLEARANHTGTQLAATISDFTAAVAAIVAAITLTSKSAAYTLVLADAGTGLLHPAADTTARIWTIPANSSVSYPVGTTLTFVNQNAGGVITIAITTDTLRLAGAGTTGSRTLAANGIATALKITSTEWIISGTGLT